jgi:hypothetical protein
MKRIAISRSWLSGHALVIVLGAAVAVVGTLIVISHKAHLARLLPYAPVLLCPLLYLFMHRGHSGHGGHGSESQSSEGETTAHHHERKES